MERISARLVSRLKDYVTPDQPLGPINAAKIDDLEVGDILFERDNKLHQAMKKNPVVVVGRRGAGKTSYLNSLHHDSNYTYVVPFDSPEEFGKIVIGIQNASVAGTLVESIAEKWRRSLMTAIFAAIVRTKRSNAGELKQTRDYLARIGVPISKGPEETMWRVVNTLSDDGEGKGIRAAARALRDFDSITYEDAEEEVTNFLNRHEQRAIVLIDSLDDYLLDDLAVGKAIAGLLKCVGMFNRAGRPFHLRFCLPAELYPSFLSISSNPSKDFEKEVLLHWHSRELLFIIAQRIKLYYRLYDEPSFAEFRDVSFDSPKGARALFHSCLPTKVKNGRGRTEQTLTYLFRHTQLLPRQILELLNNVLTRSFEDEARSIRDLSETHLVKGISQVEGRLVEQIFSAFKYRHETAREVCKRCIPELELTFSVRQLEEVFRRYGRPAFGSRDHHEFREMLIETGVVGVVTGETAEYVHGLFEYCAPHRLYVGHSDKLCLHPIFAGVFRSKYPKDSPEQKPVYPFGTDIDSHDVREYLQ